jgi:NAD-dependent deacetylase
MDPLIAQGTQIIAEARNILVFSGAGMSTESGIPDFRSPDGIWSKYDPSDFYFDRIVSSEKTREDAVPNRAHFAVKSLEERGKLLAIVTQNIDNLHQKAGNSPEKIIEIHGTAFSVSCLRCGKTYDRELIQARLRSGVKVPYCDDCAGILKPDTISFGQAMPEARMANAFRFASTCDLCIVLGSSLAVYPAASIPMYAVEGGAKLMIINRDETALDTKAELVCHDSVSEALGQMVGG